MLAGAAVALLLRDKRKPAAACALPRRGTTTWEPAPSEHTPFGIPEAATHRAPQSPGLRAANIQGLGDRENQQDSFGVTDIADTRSGLLAVVADGMGGGANGAEISGITVTHMLKAFKAARDKTDPATRNTDILVRFCA